jgi:hypothetical protein
MNEGAGFSPSISQVFVAASKLLTADHSDAFGYCFGFLAEGFGTKR